MHHAKLTLTLSWEDIDAVLRAQADIVVDITDHFKPVVIVLKG